MKISIIVSSAAIAFCLGLNLAADEHHHHGGAPAQPAPQPALKESSLFNSETQWRDQTGKEVVLKYFRGSKVLLAMAYTYCTYTCPLTVAKLKKIEGDLVAKGVSNFKIVLVSFDTKRDTPKRLASYMKQKDLNPERWTWLAPKSDKDVRELAALLGVVYSKDKSGEYSHSSIFTLLSEDGEIVERLDGINADHKGLVAKLKEDM